MRKCECEVHNQNRSNYIYGAQQWQWKYNNNNKPPDWIVKLQKVINGREWITMCAVESFFFSFSSFKFPLKVLLLHGLLTKINAIYWNYVTVRENEENENVEKI